MAGDLAALMTKLGFSRFMVAGHDRGGRVAYRLALVHPDRVEKLAALDIIPTADAWDRANARLARGYWLWSLLAQPEPLPEKIIAAAADAIVDNALGGWGSSPGAFPAAVRHAYVEALLDPAISMRSARNIGRRRHSTASMTMPTGQPPGASPARCWRSGAGMARSPSVCGRRRPAGVVAALGRRCAGRLNARRSFLSGGISGRNRIGAA